MIAIPRQSLSCLWVTFILAACLLGNVGTAASTNDCSTGGIWVPSRLASPTPQGLRLRGGDGADGRMWIVVHGVECDAATLAWEKVEGADCYEVQLKVGAEEFRTLSDKLSSTMVRKKNLQPNSEHQVRVRAKKGKDWGDFSDVLSLTTLAPQVKRLDAPTVGLHPTRSLVPHVCVSTS